MFDVFPGRLLICGSGGTPAGLLLRDRQLTDRQTDRHGDRMKSALWSLLLCAALLRSGVQATFPLSAGDPQLIAAQSYAQSRNNGRPPLRTLNLAMPRSDYTYRGGYHYHYQPPRIPPPVVYRPIPLSPPVTYHRPSVPMPPYHHHHRFNGPHMHHIYKGLSPPVSHHPHHRVKGPFPYKMKGPCPTKSDPTVAPTPVVHPPTVIPTLPETTMLPTLPATTAAPVTTIMPVVVTTVLPVETTAPVTLLVSTQSGIITTISPVETGVDPCAMGHDCEHICVNSNASYYCKCRIGYILNADKKTCSLKQVKVEVVEDPCKCEARLAFQKQTQAALQQLTAKLADVSGRIERLENMVGRA
ncbi:matrilin-3a isoform X3 [Amphiprion ocellaris]|uniref:matrilin-3a isoform X3 n=1 Tax=Amphiprion ocellaris TaxID=80972 RepID=UPI002411051A|nr:matrilin-3a isoform X3 [Amphiprion ocellaris]